MINIQNCSKSYEDSLILDKINLSAGKGDCIALLGANGCGKTTLLKIILGIIDMDEGNIDIAKDTPVGFFLDDKHLYDELSIEDNLKIYSALAMVSRRRRKDEIKRWLLYFGLECYRKKKVKKISAGMKVRAGLAIANFQEPGILVLDEPFNGLDREYVNKLTTLVQEKVKQGALVIIAAHNVELLEPLVNRWFKLEDGKLNEIDAPPPLVHCPVNGKPKTDSTESSDA